ncbi:MAG TPA: GNVR domain-containing protein [Nitrospirota bacterium]|nr:GNVR domain-containing protein [Nitrospirota bacterium]
MKNSGNVDQSKDTTDGESIAKYQDWIHGLRGKPQQSIGKITVSSGGIPKIEKSQTTNNNGSKNQSVVKNTGSLGQSQNTAGKKSIEKYQDWVHGLSGKSQQAAGKATVPDGRVPRTQKSPTINNNDSKNELAVKHAGNVDKSVNLGGRKSIEKFQVLTPKIHEKPQQATERATIPGGGIPRIEKSPTTRYNVSKNESAVKNSGNLDQSQNTSGRDLIEKNQELTQALHDKPQQSSEKTAVTETEVSKIEKAQTPADDVSKGESVVRDTRNFDKPQNTFDKDLIEINQGLIQEIQEKPHQTSEKATVTSTAISRIEKSQTPVDDVSKGESAVKNTVSLDQSQKAADRDLIEINHDLIQEIHEKPQQPSEEVTVSGGGVSENEKSTVMNHKGEFASASSSIGRHQQPGMNIIVKDERPRGTQSGDITPLDLKRYLNLIRKRRVLFASLAAVVITAAFIISHVIPPLYEAKILVSIEKNFLNDISKGLAVSPSVDSKVSALSTVLNSRTLIYKVISDLDLEVNKKSEAEIEKLIKSVQNRTEVKIEFNKVSRNDVDFFTVSFQDRDPKIARDYVNTLIGRYIEESLRYKREESTGANSFLLDQINLFKAKAGKLDEEIVRLTEKEDQAELMKKKEDEAELMKNNRIIAGDERLVELKKLQKRLDYLLVHYTDTFPEVVKVKAEIETLKAKIKANPYKPPVDDVAAKQSKGTTKAALMPDSNVKTRLAELERERDTNKRIYDELASAYGISQVSTQAEIQDRVGRFRIVDPAILPFKPVSPDRLKIMLIGIFIGLAGAFGFIIVLDSINKSVKSIDSLKKFGLPIIFVPHIPNPGELKRSRRDNIVFYGFSSLFVSLLVAVLVREVLEKLG